MQTFRKQRKNEQSKLILLGQFYPDMQTRHHEKTTNPDFSLHRSKSLNKILAIEKDNTLWPNGFILGTIVGSPSKII